MLFDADRHVTDDVFGQALETIQLVDDLGAGINVDQGVVTLARLVDAVRSIVPRSSE